MKNRYAGTAGIPVFVSACLLFSVRGNLRACCCMVFTPDRLVANRQSSRRCVFLLPPLFLSPLLRSPCFVIAFFFFLCFPSVVVRRPSAARMAAVTPVVRRPSYTLLTAATQLPWYNKGPSIVPSMMVLCTVNPETIHSQ